MAGVEALVSFAVKNLGTLLVEEALFLGKVSGKVEEMKRELTRMQIFLSDADRRRVEGDAGVINCLFEIRDLAYDAEEAIATFVLRVGRRPSAPAFFGFKSYLCFVKTCVTRHKVGIKMEEINSRIAGLTRSLQTYGVQPTATPAQPRITYSTVVEDIVIGLQGHVTAMVAHLKDRAHSRIISIWGIGGLGKTTFSKQIHGHREIEHHFDHVAWVCVSQQCNPHQVWTEILLQFVQKPEEKAEVRSMTSEELVSKLHSLQMQKKCLVILDDIWKQEDWTSLCPAFPRTTGAGSKILLTTRNQLVVSHADIQCFSYNLPLLTKEECLELLKKKVSPEAQGFVMSTEMKNVMEEIVEHCGGLPLAIVLIGGLLAKDKTLERWKKVRQDLNYSLNEGNDCNGGVRDVLALSYQDLPYYLKSCFLYFSLFPEDWVIEAKPLVQMWIAEGFVSAARGELGSKTMLDVGLS